MATAATNGGGAFVQAVQTWTLPMAKISPQRAHTGELKDRIFSRQASHTGRRDIARRGSLQRRHSAGKSVAKRPSPVIRNIALTRASTRPGPDSRGVPPPRVRSRGLLLKTTLLKTSFAQ